MPAWRAYSRSTPRRYDLGAKHDPRCMHPGISLSLYNVFSSDVMQIIMRCCAKVLKPSADGVHRLSEFWVPVSWWQVLTDKECTCNCCIREQRPDCCRMKLFGHLGNFNWGSPELFKSELELESNFYPIIIQTSSRSTSPWIWISWCTTEASKDHCRRPSEISDPSKSSFKILG